MLYTIYKAISNECLYTFKFSCPKIFRIEHVCDNDSVFTVYLQVNCAGAQVGE